MRKIFRFIVLAVFIGVIASVGWSIYGETQVSQAHNYDASVGMVQHQTVQMSASIVQTNAVITKDISEVTSLTELIDRWTPRYSQAQVSYQKFDVAIAMAEERAEAYFVSQRALTKLYHDEEKRTRAHADDEHQYQQYLEWRERARSTLAEARKIMKRLEDVDTTLQKLKLTSELDFDASSFQDVPIALTNLEGELDQFSTASENIRDTIGSPFVE